MGILKSQRSLPMSFSYLKVQKTGRNQDQGGEGVVSLVSDRYI